MTCLWLVYPGERHGWRIREWLANKEIQVGVNSVYRVLNRLEKTREWIQTREGKKQESYAGGPRTYCRLSEKGLEAYPLLRAEMVAMADRIRRTARAEREGRTDLGEAANG